MTYIFDYTILIQQLLPYCYFFSSNVSWLKSILKPLYTLKKYIFEYYTDGVVGYVWTSFNYYVIGDIAIQLQSGSVYTCINPCIGIFVTNTDYWQKIQDTRIGVNTRVNYKNNKLAFETALNEYFYATTIYIETTPIKNPFAIGISNSSSVGVTNSSESIPLTTIYNDSDFTIFMPSTIFAGLGSNAEKLIRSFADKINMAGMTYTVTTF